MLRQVDLTELYNTIPTVDDIKAEIVLSETKAREATKFLMAKRFVNREAKWHIEHTINYWLARRDAAVTVFRLMVQIAPANTFLDATCVQYVPGRLDRHVIADLQAIIQL